MAAAVQMAHVRRESAFRELHAALTRRGKCVLQTDSALGLQFTVEMDTSVSKGHACLSAVSQVAENAQATHSLNAAEMAQAVSKPTVRTRMPSVRAKAVQPPVSLEPVPLTAPSARPLRLR